MNLFYDDFDRRFLAEIKRQEEAEARVRITADELEELRKKARLYEIISVATPTQFGQIWDRMVRGENFDKLVEELGRIQTELSAMKRAEGGTEG